MLDVKRVVANPDEIRRNCELRGTPVDLDAIIRLEGERKRLAGAIDDTRREIKTLASKFRSSASPDQQREEARKLKADEDAYAKALSEVEQQLTDQMSALPNILDPRVPIGGETDSKELRKVGAPRAFSFEPKSHADLGALLNLIDIPRGVKTAKSRFYCLKNEAVRMRYALVQMFLEHVQPQGFELICPPFLAKTRTLFASGYLPFAQKDNFKIEAEDLSLIGTSEQALLGIHMDEILTELPVLYLGDSMCFRTEAGSYGKDTAGILRVHQFYKLEQIVYCHPKASEEWHLRCLENEEWMLSALELPYRVVLIASQDLGAPGAIKYDTEVWFPSQRAYREATSNTNLTDFQTRRGNIRFKLEGEKGFPHTISATGFTDRLIIAILENNQEADGTVTIPKRLVPYMGGQTVISPR
jgi:seryl-tRNA synthetase